ncbi:MAG: FecR domain-containing protein [Vulcanimicrobiaceae bacterium]
MTLRRPFFLAFALLLATGSLPSAADTSKELQNVKGDVAYQAPNQAAKPIAPNASIALADKTFAITGSESIGAVTLPDSSKVLVGSNSKVQMAFFSQAEGNTAKFIVYNGSTRFTVQHPQGAAANYTFQTPTATVGVRGTQGDIGVASDGTLTVNVYEVSNPNLPVTVQTTDGHRFVVAQGQSFAARLVNGVVQAEVSKLTQGAVDQFTGDFGLPTNWDQLKNEVINQVQSKIPVPSIPGVPFPPKS